MIIVKLQGGLGNQMFQYALGRTLSLRTGSEVLFDKSWYSNVLKTETVRTYELDVFAFPIRFASQQDIPWEQAPGKNRFVALRNGFLRKFPVWRKFCGQPVWKILFEHSLGANPISQIRPEQSIFLNGYWQSEKYFKEVKDVIRHDFVFKIAPDEANQSILNKIDREGHDGIEAVSIHIRRGDYSLDPKTQAHHGLLPLTYYRSGMSILEKRFSKLAYYVFSDDLNWCRENLNFKENVTFVDINSGNKGWMDMRLMSHCQHHIIANSSFSWWGAWLNPNQHKMVIAPQEWVAQAIPGNEDIVPDGWLRISKNG